MQRRDVDESAMQHDREVIDLAVVGAGAAGLMAAIVAGRTAAGQPSRECPRIVAYDSARTLGAKILVAGGGRCNVTHHEVSERDYCGSTAPAIRKVLRRFTVADTVRFFSDLGVQLKREETGKLFPVTDQARTVLGALLRAAESARVQIEHPCRVAAIKPPDETSGGMFMISLQPPAGGPKQVLARRVILATGGCSLPKSGSDGHGHVMARALGHTVTPAVFPALVPLVLGSESILRTLAGITLRARLTVTSGTGKHLVSTESSTLLTHFGLSGPSVLDISRHWTAARRSDPLSGLEINWLPGMAPAELDAALQQLGKRSVRGFIRTLLPERLADALLSEANIPADLPGHALTRLQRTTLRDTLTTMRLPVTGDRGFTFAETTAGGVPLAEVELATMMSRRATGLHVIGEVLDVDGRIGGFNFQWAWATGFIAGTACGAEFAAPRQS